MNTSRQIQRISAVPADVKPTKFSHFVLKTSRFQDTVNWYLTVLCATVAQRNERLCFMTYDEEHHRVAIVNVPELDDRPKDACGVDHVSYTYATLPELLATYRRLKARGIVPRWAINHGVTTSLYYQDPDGNRVELQFENFPTDEELNSFFRSEAFAQNTLGDRFDPEELITRYEAGAPIEELTKVKGTAFGEPQVKILEEMGLLRR